MKKEYSQELQTELQKLASSHKRLRIDSPAKTSLSFTGTILKKLEQIVSSKRIAIDSETTGLQAWATAFMYSLCDDKGNAVALYKTNQQLPCLACKGEGSRLAGKSLRVPQLWQVHNCRTCGGRGVASGEALVIWIIGRICSDPSIVKIFHHAKFDWQRAINDGITVNGTIHDTQLMHYVLDTRRPHGLKELAQTKLKLGIEDQDELIMWIKAARAAAYNSVIRYGYYLLDGKIELNPDVIFYRHAPREIIDRYAIEDVVRTQYLFHYAKAPIKKFKGYRNNYLMEMALMPVSKEMEQRGMRWDMDLAYRLLRIVKKDEAIFKEEAYKHAKHEFNILSPKQVCNILFNELNIEIIHRTKKGNPSTSRESMQAYDHPVISQINRYRMAKKMDQTIRSFIRYAHKEDNIWVIHPSILQHGARTGRYSMTNPPLQTVAALDTGKISPYIVSLRKCFIPRHGFIFYLFDFSQIEMKLFAVLSGEPDMMDAVKHGRDLHDESTRILTGAKPGDHEYMHNRKITKTINFAVIYGAGESKIELALRGLKGGIEFYHKFHKAFPGIREFMDETMSLARRQGYVETAFGMRIPVDRYAPHKGVNYIIQGTAAGVLKRATIRTAKELKKMGGFLVNTIHDEIIPEVPEGWDHASTIPHLKATMEYGWEDKFGVPLRVDSAVSAISWGDELEVDLKNEKTIRGSVAEALRLRDLLRQKPYKMGDLRVLR